MGTGSVVTNGEVWQLRSAGVAWNFGPRGISAFGVSLAAWAVLGRQRRRFGCVGWVGCCTEWLTWIHGWQHLRAALVYVWRCRYGRVGWCIGLAAWIL